MGSNHFPPTSNIRFFTAHAILAADLLRQQNMANPLEHGVYCVILTEACCGLGHVWLTMIGRHMLLLLCL